jgi:2-oxoacid:acceptor oxidoreductase delta subunit (pyruvate/2-ketoisovalerate family)
MDLPISLRTKEFATQKTGSWRTERPVIDPEKCVGCPICFEYCPEGIISKVSKNEVPDIDYDFCKGCGICAQECKVGAIEMVLELEES